MSTSIRARPDCAFCDPDTNRHVDVKEWAGYVVEVMDSLKVTSFVPVGILVIANQICCKN